MPGPREIIIILVIVLLLFGAPKLPQLARSLGQSMRILKDETKAMRDDAPADAAAPTPPAATPPPATTPAPEVPPAPPVADEPRGKE